MREEGKRKYFNSREGKATREAVGAKGKKYETGGKDTVSVKKAATPHQNTKQSRESTGSKAIRQRTLHVETTRGEEERTSASPIPLSKRLRHHKSSVCVSSTRQNSSPHHAHVHTPSTAGGKWLEDKVKGATPSTFLSLSHPLVLINRDVSFSGPHPHPEFCTTLCRLPSCNLWQSK